MTVEREAMWGNLPHLMYSCTAARRGILDVAG
jgi:hypothetical protein